MSTDKGRDETREMWELIGRAISQWAFVEERLGAVFMVCVGNGTVSRGEHGGLNFWDMGVASAAFYSVENFRSKLALVDASLTTYIYDAEDWAVELRSDWTKLSKKTAKLSQKRNRLAHWSVLPGHDYEDRTKSPRLIPPYGSPGWYRETGLNPGRQSQSTAQLRHLELAFHLLSEKLWNFADRIAKQEQLFDRYVEHLAVQIDSYCRSNPKRGERLRKAILSLD